MKIPGCTVLTWKSLGTHELAISCKTEETTASRSSGSGLGLATSFLCFNGVQIGKTWIFSIFAWCQTFEQLLSRVLRSSSIFYDFWVQRLLLAPVSYVLSIFRGSRPRFVPLFAWRVADPWLMCPSSLRGAAWTSALGSLEDVRRASARPHIAVLGSLQCRCERAGRWTAVLRILDLMQGGVKTASTILTAIW